MACRSTMQKKHRYLSCRSTQVRTAPYVAVGGTYAAPDESEVYVNAAPPPPVSEYRPYPPEPGYAWVDGYWDWTGYDWYWVSGYWAPPRMGYYYVRPSYVVNNG